MTLYKLIANLENKNLDQTSQLSNFSGSLEAQEQYEFLLISAIIQLNKKQFKQALEHLDSLPEVPDDSVSAHMAEVLKFAVKLICQLSLDSLDAAKLNYTRLFNQFDSVLDNLPHLTNSLISLLSFIFFGNINYSNLFENSTEPANLTDIVINYLGHKEPSKTKEHIERLIDVKVQKKQYLEYVKLETVKCYFDYIETDSMEEALQKAVNLAVALEKRGDINKVKPTSFLKKQIVNFKAKIELLSAIYNKLSNAAEKSSFKAPTLERDLLIPLNFLKTSKNEEMLRAALKSLPFVFDLSEETKDDIKDITETYLHPKLIRIVFLWLNKKTKDSFLRWKRLTNMLRKNDVKKVENYNNKCFQNLLKGVTVDKLNYNTYASVKRFIKINSDTLFLDFYESFLYSDVVKSISLKKVTNFHIGPDTGNTRRQCKTDDIQTIFGFTYFSVRTKDRTYDFVGKEEEMENLYRGFFVAMPALGLKWPTRTIGQHLVRKYKNRMAVKIFSQEEKCEKFGIQLPKDYFALRKFIDNLPFVKVFLLFYKFL